MKLRLEVGELQFLLNLQNTPTAKAVFDAAPFEGRASTWGEEVYFATPVSAKLDERPKLASRCNVLGRLEGNPKALGKIRSGDKISVTRA